MHKRTKTPNYRLRIHCDPQSPSRYYSLDYNSQPKLTYISKDFLPIWRKLPLAGIDCKCTKAKAQADYNQANLAPNGSLLTISRTV